VDYWIGWDASGELVPGNPETCHLADEETVKDPLLSRFCRRGFSLPQKFISRKWKNYGRMKLLLRGLGRVS
jgi:hypothetical protein